MLIEQCVQHLLSQHRISNEPAKLIPLYYRNGVYLPYYCCMMLGKRNNKSYVETFYIEKYIYLGFTHYAIAWFPLHDFSIPPVRFWVYTGATLKKRIFRFEDHIPFRKCVYIYLPFIGITRLSMIPYCIIPEAMAESFTIVKDYQVTVEKSSAEHAEKNETKHMSSLSEKMFRAAEPSLLNSQSLQLLHQVSKELTSEMLSCEQKSLLKIHLDQIKMK